MKVKEPLPEEYSYLRAGLLLFTYLHVAANPELAKALMSSKVRAIGYENVQLANGALPLLSPMSEIAGRMAVQIGAQFLEKSMAAKSPPVRCSGCSKRSGHDYWRWRCRNQCRENGVRAWCASHNSRCIHPTLTRIRPAI